MDKNYQINLPPAMPPRHPDSITTVIPSLSANVAERVFHFSTSDSIIIANMHQASMLKANIEDIFQSNLYRNQKKEVNDIIMNLKHCKSFQYNMKWPVEQKFFNN